MNVHVVIPARLASTRLPRKPLADLGGKPMIVRVAEQVSQAHVSDVIVAVDNEEVLGVVEQAGYQAMLTAQTHPSGSDRVMEVARRCTWVDDDVVINVQGDEPLVPPEVINYVATYMREHPSVQLATLCESICGEDDFKDPNIVKVVCDKNRNALYFSRAQIPYPREDLLDDAKPQRHIGIYAFRVGALRDFVSMTNSQLERIEKLEQLRWLEEGRQIKVLTSPMPIPGGIDTPADLARVQKYFQAG